MFDCQQCGACCVNPPPNREASFDWWVEIAGSDRILTRADLKRYVVRDAEGVPHLRLVTDGRCMGLTGELGVSVACEIYPERPTPCRTVQPGDQLCLRYRDEHGVR